MSTASALRVQIESTLAQRIPSALTPQAHVQRAVVSTGIPAVDTLLRGGLPLGAITEIVGPASSGRTACAQSFLAQAIQSDRVAAWIDVSDCFDPESAASNGVDLERLLWVRCGGGDPAAAQASPERSHQPGAITVRSEPIPPAGGSPHPRSEVRGLSHAIDTLLTAQPAPPRRDKRIGTPGMPNRDLHSRTEQVATDRLPARRGEYLLQHRPSIEPVCAESQRKERPAGASRVEAVSPKPAAASFKRPRAKVWDRLEQALRVADLLMQSGGFSVIVLDMGSIAPEHASRVPLATWFRLRAASERTQAAFLLLTQHPCAQSSAEVVLRTNAAAPEVGTVLTHLPYTVELVRQRFQEVATKIVPMRKPPQRSTEAAWEARPAWIGGQVR